MFPLFVIDVEYVNLTVRTQHSSILWHQRYMHLNDKGLKIFKQKGLVKGLPYIDQIGVCEGYIYRKQKLSFPTGEA